MFGVMAYSSPSPETNWSSTCAPPRPLYWYPALANALSGPTIVLLAASAAPRLHSLVPSPSDRSAVGATP